jgi:hypothetical protein
VFVTPSRELYIWDPAVRTLTALGAVWLVPVAGHGWWIERYLDGRFEIVDIDPDRSSPRLRPVWRIPTAAGFRQSWGGIAGVLDGTVVALARSSDNTRGGASERRSSVTLACLYGPGQTVTRQVSLANNVSWASRDAFRGHRMLAWRDKDEPDTYARGAWHTDVVIHDLDSGRERSVGQAVGGWTTTTAMPHAYMELRWKDDETSSRDPNPAPEGLSMADADGGWNTIDPHTEKVSGIGPYEPALDAH